MSVNENDPVNKNTANAENETAEDISREISNELVQSESDSEEEEAETNEAEIPIRLSKKKKKKKSSRKRRRRKKRPFEVFKKIKRVYVVLSASSDDGPLKPINIFGFKIKYWPLILIFLLVMMLFTVVIKNGQVTTVEQNISVVGLADDLENYKILVLSDLNAKRFGDEQSLLMRSIDAADYDIILCVGDMVGESGDATPFYEFLDALSRPSKVYFICGDSDPGPYVSVPRSIEGTLREIVLEDWILGAIERGANYVDSPTQITVGESSIWLTPTSYLNTEATEFRADWKDQMEQEESGVITGLSSDYNTLPITSYRYLLAKKFFTAANSIQSTDLLIGLSHIVPDDDYIISSSMHDDDDGVYLSEPELIISGHYCGGVWKLPFIGALYIPNRMLPRYGWFPDQEDVDGLSQIGETQVYISPGLSTTSSIKLLPFRLNNDPTMTVLTFTASLPESMLDE